MASIEEIRLEIEGAEELWSELKPMLLKCLPHDLSRVEKAERFLTATRRCFERASQVERQGRNTLAFWWYCRTLSAWRHYRSVAEVLLEGGLEAQKKEKALIWP